MRNIYIGKAAERSLGRHLTSILKSSLDEIDPSLRVRTPHVQFARAYDKEFSRSANYVKGHGEFNMSWLMAGRQCMDFSLVFHLNPSSLALLFVYWRLNLSIIGMPANPSCLTNRRRVYTFRSS